MNILVIGSINIDYSSFTKNLPNIGETISAHKFKISPGGKGLNQAVAAARLGANVSMLAKIGNDSIGDNIINLLIKENIDTSRIVKSNNNTGNALITIDQKGDNTIVIYPGANADVNRKYIDDNIDMIEKADLIIMQLEIPISTVEYIAAIGKELNKIIVLNPAPAQTLSHTLLENIDYITPNETELTTLTGSFNIKEGAKILLSYGMKGVVCTCGSKGCFYLDNEQELFVDAFKVKAIDTTAAGDSFNAGFIIGLLNKQPISETLRFANGAGALAATKLGAMESLSYLIDVNEFIDNN